MRNTKKNARISPSWQQTELRHTQAMHGMSDGLWDWNIATKDTYLSPRWKALLGFADDELPNHEDSFLPRLLAEDVSRFEAAIQAHFINKHPFDIEIRLCTKDGDYRWFRSHGQAEWDENGAPLRMVGLLTAIHDVKLLQEQLQRANEAFRHRNADETPESRSLLHRLVDSVRDYAIFALDAEGVIITWNTEAARLKGYRADEIIGEHFSIFYSSDDVAEGKPQRELKIAQSEGRLEDEGWRIRKDGSRFWASVIIAPMWGAEGLLQGYSKVTRDISERKRAEEALFEEKEWARITLSSIADAVITTDKKGKVSYLNPIAEEMTGWSAEAAVGATIEQVMVICNATNGNFMANPIRLALQEERNVWMEANCLLKSRDNRESYIEDSAAPIRNSNGVVIGAVLVFHDVSQARAIASKMSHMAQHDALTDLPNRLLLQARITQAIQSAQRDSKQFALFFLDLDHFKNINDSLGHAAGDDLLRSIATRLTDGLRSSDTVSRQGGDEFVVLAWINSTEHAGQIAQRLLDIVAEPFAIAEERMDIAFSMGISIYPEDGVDTDALMRHADAAMYSAKKAGRNGYKFFSSDIDEAVTLRHVLQREIREALEANQFSVYYQLKVNGATNEILGTEALVRWHRLGGEVYLPVQFIPLAEESGLIIPLGRFVLREACRQNQQWRASGFAPLLVAVNISAVQLRDTGFLAMVEQVLSDTGMAPQYLELEITEGTLIEATENAIFVLEKLREMGVRVALDDFGTGYSSLSYLRQFPVDTLKIDRTFVTDLLKNANDAAIVTAIVGMGRGLGLEVIAEGVESEEQAVFLRGVQCHVMQGYLFSRPLNATQITETLQSRTA